MKHIISKDIEFCFGHRVWVQKLDAECSLSKPLCCRRLHGHGGKITVHLSAEVLDSQQMVTDFGNLNWLKRFIDDHIDHCFLIDIHDPLYHKFIPDGISLKPIFISGVTEKVGDMVDLSCRRATTTLENSQLTTEGGLYPQSEWYESFFVVGFAPTSENLSKWIFDFASKKMKSLGKVVRVDWHETTKSKASFIGE